MSTRKKTNDDLASDDQLGAAAAVTASSQGTDSPTLKNPKAPKKTRYPCGKCDNEATGHVVCCNSCELWYHFGCIDGMNKEYFDNCKKGFELNGYSAFLCKVCRKVLTAIKKSMKDLKDEVKEMKDKMVVLELEKEALAQKLEKMEMKAEKVTERVVGVEKEVSTGMEKAMEEVKKDVKTELVAREERGCNVVVYGLDETNEEDVAQWKTKEQKKVDDVIAKLGVNVKGDVSVKFRAGKRRGDGDKPRPVIVRVDDDETRMSIFKNAPRLSRMDETKRVFFAPDLTWQQREEERKNELTLKEEAAKKTEEAKNGGRGKWYRVVGARGRRRIVEVDERVAENP